MKIMTNLTLTALLLVCGMSTATAADAALVININEVGADVISTGFGTIDTTVLREDGAEQFTTEIRPDTGVVFVGPQTPTRLFTNAFSTTSAFGPGPGAVADSGTGDTFGIYGVAGFLLLPVDYASGTALSGTAIFSDRSFDSLGLTQGVYTYALRNGDTLTVNVGQIAAVPETAAWGMMIAGFGMIGSGLRSRRRSTKATFA